MFLSFIPLSSVTEGDIRRLVDEPFSETRELEFKAGRYGNSDADKREWLKDITALANTAGGHLLIGIREQVGIAVAVVPISDTPADAELLRLENLLNSSVEPRLLGVELRSVDVAGGFVIVARVPRSRNAPHRVVHGNSNRFYARNSAGVFEMTTMELRAAFLRGHQFELEVRQWRDTRLALLNRNRGSMIIKNVWTMHGDTPLYNIDERPPLFGMVVLHIVPYSFIGGAFDIKAAVGLSPALTPLGSTLTDEYRPNLEGLVTFVGKSGDGVSAYCQTFRDGRVEAVRGQIANPKGRINNIYVEDDIIRCLPKYIDVISRLGATGPYAVMLSIIGVLGRHLTEQSMPCDRSDILLDPFIIEESSLSGTWQYAIKPTFDAMWNAFGRMSSPNFTSDGLWNPKAE